MSLTRTRKRRLALKADIKVLPQLLHSLRPLDISVNALHRAFLRLVCDKTLLPLPRGQIHLSFLYFPLIQSGKLKECKLYFQSH